MLGDAIASKKGIFVRKKETKPEKSFLVSLTNSLTEYLNCLYVYQVSLYSNKLQSDLTKLLGTNLSPVTLNATNPFLSWDITVWRFYRQIKFFFRWLLKSASGLGAIWSESIHLLSSFGCLKCWNETFTVDPVIASLFAFFGKPQWPIWWIFAVNTLTCGHLGGKAETAKAEAFLVDKLVDNNLFCTTPQFGR